MSALATISTPSARLRQLAGEVRRIHDPFRFNPERVLQQKDDIAHELRRIADLLEARRG